MRTLTFPGQEAGPSSKELSSRGAMRLVMVSALVSAGFTLGCSRASYPPRTEASLKAEELRPKPQVVAGDLPREQHWSPADSLAVPRLKEFVVEAAELLLQNWEKPLVLEHYRESQVLLRPGAKSQAAAGGFALVMVDDFAPRRLRSTRELTLGDLVPEDRELTEGEHLLVIALGEESGTPVSSKLLVQVVPFMLGGKGGAALAETKHPSCRILHPFGTHHGPESMKALRFLAVSTGLTKESIEVEVDGRKLTTEGQSLETGVAYSLGMLSTGDHEISCRLGREGAPEHRHTVTLTPLVVPKKEGKSKLP